MQILWGQKIWRDEAWKFLKVNFNFFFKCPTFSCKLSLKFIFLNISVL